MTTKKNNDQKNNLTARELTAQILLQVFYQGAYANLALDRGLNSSRLQANDRALVTELVNGTVRMKKHLDWVLNLFLTRKGKKLPGRIYVILVSAIYQLLFLERIPAYAVINEAVDLARRNGGPNWSGLVNGILRNLDRSEGITYPDPLKDPVMYLSTFYSHPEWMVRRWLNRYGYDMTEQLMRFNNQAPSMTIRVNTLKTDRQTLLDVLKGEGAAARPGTVSDESIIIENLPEPLFRLPSYRQGLYYVQSESTMLIGPALFPEPGQMIYDICSGVGGKSTHIAELMHNKGGVRSFDLYEHKLELLKLNCERLGISIVQPRPGDILARTFGNRQADGVLLDAPCSGLGVLRSRADLRWRREETDIAAMADLQFRMVAHVADAVRPGGHLVYSTCTIEPEENQAVVQGFLAKRPDFEGQDLTAALDFFPFNDEERIDAQHGLLTVFPPRHQLDGMFIALMRRR